MSGNFFSIIMLAMALYVLVSGITGKGKLYAVEGVPEEKRPKFNKILRCLYITMGLFMALNTGTSYLRDQMYQAVAYGQTAATAEATASPAADTSAVPETSAAPAAEASAVPETSAAPAAEASAVPETSVAPETAAAPVVATTSGGYEIVRTDKFPGINISYKALNVIAFVMLGITMAAVVAMFVVINKFVDKEAARKAQEAKGKQGGSARRGGRDSQPAMPKSAFEFDDEPEENNKQ